MLNNDVFPGLILLIGLIVALYRVNKIDTDVIPAVDAYVKRYFPPNLLKTDKIKENSFSQVKYEEFTPDHFLIVDCRETLAQLLTNGFHRDHNCMIMTSDKFPKKAFDYYQDISSPIRKQNFTCSMTHLLRGSDWE